MKYKRRGRFLDSEDGKWVICKDLTTGTYTILNKETHEYIKEKDGVILRRFGYLRDAKRCIDFMNGEV